ADAAGVLPEHVNERQRDLPFAQIARNRLAARFVSADKVEQMADELDRDAEMEAVLAKRVFLLFGDLAEHAADLRAAAEEKRGLAPHDLAMLVLRDVGVAACRQLIQLAFNHAERDVAQEADDLERVARERERHRLD